MKLTRIYPPVAVICIILGWGQTFCQQDGLRRYHTECSDVRLFLWTRDNPDRPVEVVIGDYRTLRWFRPRHQTHIYIHEYTGSGRSDRINNMKNEYLKKSNCNFLSVDYKPISLLPLLVDTAEYVGLCVAEFIRFLPQPPELVHVIGFSLGTHAAGFIKFGLPRGTALGRITALDPGRQFFRKANHTVRLDPSDANFVSVIYTNYGMLGLDKPVGHAEFYVNGGRIQPGCPGYLLGGILEYIGAICSHFRVVPIFTETINSIRGFQGCRPGGPCYYMGEPLSHSARGKFHVRTRATPPYAV